MAWDFIANTRAELLERVEEQCVSGQVSGTVATERICMVRLLQALARADRLQYPVCMRHTSESVPDFQLRVGGVDVSVEVTRIPFPNVEAARALQGRYRTGVLDVSSLSMLGGKKAKTPEIQRLGFGTDVFVNPPGVLEEGQVFATQVMRALSDKTDVIEGLGFVHGEHDWLLLADSLGIEDWQLDGRIECISTLLRKFWKPGWYSKVFLQEQRFRFQVELTAQGHVLLPAWRPSQRLPDSFIFDEE